MSAENQEVPPAADAPATTEAIYKDPSVQDVIKRISEENAQAEIDESPPDDPTPLEHEDEGEPAGEPLPDQDEPAEGAPASEPTAWITDSDRARAQAYDLTNEELEVFSSREEFGRWASLTDRANSRKQPKLEPAREAKPADAAPQPEDADQMEVAGKVNPAYFEKRTDEFGPETIIAMKALRQQQDVSEKLAAQNEAAQKREQDQQWTQYFNVLHDTLDNDPSGVFGKTVDAKGQLVRVDDKAWNFRGKVNEQVQVLTDVYRLQGRPIPAMPTLIEQAKQMIPELVTAMTENAKKSQGAERQGKLERIAEQSRKRRPVASSVGAGKAYQNSPPADPNSTEAIYRHPNVQSVLKRIAEANGY